MKKTSLEPLGSVVSVLFSLGWILLVTGAALKIYGLFHGTVVCFDVNSGIDDLGVDTANRPAAALHAAATTSVQELRVCLTEPGTPQRMLGILLDAPTSFCHVGGLFLLLTLLRRAEHEGIHTNETALRVGRLGYFLLIGLPVATLLESFARTTLLRISTSADPGALSFIGDWELPLWAVITGLGMIVLSRIMRASAEMREELEGTV